MQQASMSMQDCAHLAEVETENFRQVGPRHALAGRSLQFLSLCSCRWNPATSRVDDVVLLPRRKCRCVKRGLRRLREQRRARCRNHLLLHLLRLRLRRRRSGRGNLVGRCSGCCRSCCWCRRRLLRLLVLASCLWWTVGGPEAQTAHLFGFGSGHLTPVGALPSTCKRVCHYPDNLSGGVIGTIKKSAPS